MGMFGGRGLKVPGIGDGPDHNSISENGDVVAKAHAIAMRLRGDGDTPDGQLALPSFDSKIAEYNVGHFTITSRGLKIAGKPSYEEWYEFGEWLQFMDQAVQFAIGDWINYGENRWGEKYAQAVAKTGIDEGTLRNYASVSARVDLSLRNDKLSYTHYQEIAKIKDRATQEKYIQHVATNKLTTRETQAVVRQRTLDKKAIAPPVGQYTVILADPPWAYENSGFEQSANSHYPTMTADEICAMKLGDIGTDDATLFLWATSPLLPDALKVMAAWGFNYKASIMWKKNRAPGMGWWVRTYHEILLIGARGNRQPDWKPDSVIEADVQAHSQKPDVFYEVIEQMYPGERYIELFARRHDRENWEVWGNEV